MDIEEERKVEEANGFSQFMFKTKKTSFKSLFKNLAQEDFTRIKEDIIDAVNRVHYIMYHTYQFVKLWYLWNSFLFDDVPVLNSNLLVTLTTIISNNGKLTSKEIYEQENYEFTFIHRQASYKLNAITFYREYYQELIWEPRETSNSKIHESLGYECNMYITSLETNIRENIFSYYLKFHYAFLKVFHYPDDTEKTKKLKKEALQLTHELISMDWNEYVYAKNDENQSITSHLDNLIPLYMRYNQIYRNKYEEFNLVYEAKKNPQKFIPVII